MRGRKPSRPKQRRKAKGGALEAVVVALLKHTPWPAYLIGFIMQVSKGTVQRIRQALCPARKRMYCRQSTLYSYEDAETFGVALRRALLREIVKPKQSPQESIVIALGKAARKGHNSHERTRRRRLHARLNCGIRHRHYKPRHYSHRGDASS